MGHLISNNELTKQLENIIPNCLKLNIISAFITKPATSWLENLIGNNSTTVTLVGRLSPQDFLSGASDINAIKECLLNKYTVKSLSNLHAKIYQLDEECIFTGSANLTGKGLALFDEGNLESCVKVAPTEFSKSFISKIIDSSTSIDLDMLKKMNEYIEAIPSSSKSDIPQIWPENIMPSTTEIFISDFPFGRPGEIQQAYVINSSLPFAIVEAKNKDFDTAKVLFKKSKAYVWLRTLIENNRSERELRFGQISKALHDILSDDPAPYRREIKDFQANLYDYVRLYASDEMEICIPGKRSEVIRTLKNG